MFTLYVGTWWADSLKFISAISKTFLRVIIFQMSSTSSCRCADWIDYVTYINNNALCNHVLFLWFMWWYMIAWEWMPVTSNQRWVRWWLGAIRQQAFAWTKNRSGYIMLLVLLLVLSYPYCSDICMYVYHIYSSRELPQWLWPLAIIMIDDPLVSPATKA